MGSSDSPVRTPTPLPLRCAPPVSSRAHPIRSHGHSTPVVKVQSQRRGDVRDKRRRGEEEEGEER